MTTAQQFLVAYGVIILSYGMLLGVPISRARMAAPTAPRHLVNAHLSALMQGPIHLGLAAALSLTAWDSGFATTAAVLLVIGSALEALGGTLNWLKKSGDQFAERSPGFLFNALSGPIAVVAILIFAIGVLSNL